MSLIIKTRYKISNYNNKEKKGTNKCMYIRNIMNNNVNWEAGFTNK